MLQLSRLVLLAALPLLVGCPQPDPVPEPFPPEPEPQAQLEPAPSPGWSREALEDQPRMRELRARTPGALGFDPGTTEWRSAEREIPPLLRSPVADESTATPGAAVQTLMTEWALSDQLGTDVWELTIRVWNPDESSALGVILTWGFQDDSVAGQDFRVHLRREGDSWFVERVEERVHCWRGVTPEGLCV